MRALRIALAALVIAGAVALAVGSRSAPWLADGVAWARQHRDIAGVSFLAVYALAAVLAVPGSILTVGAGYVFGLPLGAALVSAGSVLGALAAFLVGRFVARDWVLRRVAASARFRALDEVTRRDAFAIVLLTRLSPLVPYNLLNYALSVTSVGLRDYALATWIGMLPATVSYVYFGSLAHGAAELWGPDRAPAPGAHAMLALGFAATAALTVLIARRATRVLKTRLAETEPRLARPHE